MPTGHALPYVPPSPLRIANRNNRAPRRAASPSPAPESARQAPPKGNFSRQSCRLSIQAGGFPRGKQSARRALPCVPLVVCLNSGSLTAFGGCIHWIPASLRSPLHPFGSPTETIERLIGLQVLLPRRSRRVKPRQGEFFTAKLSLIDTSRGLSSGQTIGAARTAVRPACCLPELRVANRLRRLYPLDTCFPTFPPAPLRIANRNNRASHRAASSPPAPESARQAPPGGILAAKLSPVAASRGAFRSPPCTPFGPYSACRAGGMRLRAHWGLSARPQSPSVATRSNRAPHRAASPLLAPTPARHPPPIQNGPRQEIPSPPGAVRMFCYPFTAPAITPDTMYFWHAR